MFKIGIIKKNDFKIEINKINYEYIDSIVKDYVFYIDCEDPENMMENIIKETNMKPDILCMTSTCYENENTMIQICSSSEETCINGIASYLVYEKRQTFGICAIIKYNILDNIPKHESITNKDISDVLHKHLCHLGLYITPCDTIKEIYYAFDPLEYFAEELDKITYIDVKCLGFTLIIYIYESPENNKINNYASELFQNLNIHGNVLICLRINNTEFIDLTRDLYFKISSILSDPDFMPMLKDDERFGIIDNKVYNPYYLINKRIKEIKINKIPKDRTQYKNILEIKNEK